MRKIMKNCSLKLLRDPYKYVQLILTKLQNQFNGERLVGLFQMLLQALDIHREETNERSPKPQTLIQKSNHNGSQI